MKNQYEIKFHLQTFTVHESEPSEEDPRIGFPIRCSEDLFRHASVRGTGQNFFLTDIILIGDGAQGSDQQLLLAFEVQVDNALAQPRLFGHFRHGGR